MKKKKQRSINIRITETATRQALERQKSNEEIYGKLKKQIRETKGKIETRNETH